MCDFVVDANELARHGVGRVSLTRQGLPVFAHGSAERGVVEELNESGRKLARITGDDQAGVCLRDLVVDANLVRHDNGKTRCHGFHHSDPKIL